MIVSNLVKDEISLIAGTSHPVLADEVSTKVLPGDSISEIKGINDRLSRAMKNVGIDTIEEAKGYSVDELCAKLNVSQDEALDFIDLVLDYEEAKEREED